jgi:hypothetical protein
MEGCKMSRFSKYRDRFRSRSINDGTIGLSQGRFFDRSNKPNKYYRTRSFKITPSQSKSISSGSIIISIGLIVGIGIPSFAFDSYLVEFGFLYSNSPIEGLTNLTIEFAAGLIFNYGLIIPSMVIGWLMGGLTAAFIYKKEGSRGPIYSSIILISSTLSIGLISVMTTYFINSQFDSLALSDVIIPMFSVLIIGLVLSVVSIPMVLVAIIGYKSGIYLSNL